MKFLITLSLIFIMTRYGFSQAFIATVDDLPLNTETVVTGTDGSVVTGVLRSSIMLNGNIQSFRLKDAEGNIHKFNSKDVESEKLKFRDIAWHVFYYNVQCQ